MEANFSRKGVKPRIWESGASVEGLYCGKLGLAAEDASKSMTT
jgi:hypothetical protein